MQETSQVLKILKHPFTCKDMQSHNVKAHVDHLERFSRVKHGNVHEEQNLRHDHTAGHLHA